MSTRQIISFALAFLGHTSLLTSEISASTQQMRMVSVPSIDKNKFLFDFTAVENLNNWMEESDVVRTVGMSKAIITLQKTQVFQRAIFFTLLNPQPNGAGFAGVRTFVNFDLQAYNNIYLHARAQGSNSGYKVVLRHKNQNAEPHPTYEQMFTMPMREFHTIALPLDNFKPFYRGRELNSTEAEALDKSQITSFGLQVYGGVYLPVKQSGTSSLEVDWIVASAN